MGSLKGTSATIVPPHLIHKSPGVGWLASQHTVVINWRRLLARRIEIGKFNAFPNDDCLPVFLNVKVVSRYSMIFDHLNNAVTAHMIRQRNTKTRYESTHGDWARPCLNAGPVQYRADTEDGYNAST
jgi:hypothetical protein